MIILGVDPGTAVVGYAILNAKKGNNVKVIDFGCITTSPKDCAGERLKQINNRLNKLIEAHGPKIIAVENLFFFKNLKTAMPVSQAKGVILLTAAKKKIPVYEFTPLQMKMAITGYGKAEKKQVQKMIEKQIDLTGFDLKQKNRKKDDAIDALGIALCYVFNSRNISQMKTKRLKS